MIHEGEQIRVELEKKTYTGTFKGIDHFGLIGPVLFLEDGQDVTPWSRERGLPFDHIKGIERASD